MVRSRLEPPVEWMKPVSCAEVKMEAERDILGVLVCYS